MLLIPIQSKEEGEKNHISRCILSISKKPPHVWGSGVWGLAAIKGSAPSLLLSFLPGSMFKKYKQSQI